MIRTPQRVKYCALNIFFQVCFSSLQVNERDFTNTFIKRHKFQARSSFSSLFQLILIVYLTSSAYRPYKLNARTKWSYTWMIHKIPTDEFVIVGNFQFHVVGFLSLPETVYMRFLLGFFRFLSDFSLSLRTGVLKTHVNTMQIMVPCVFSTDPKYKGL